MAGKTTVGKYHSTRIKVLHVGSRRERTKCKSIKSKKNIMRMSTNAPKQIGLTTLTVGIQFDKKICSFKCI